MVGAGGGTAGRLNPCMIRGISLYCQCVAVDRTAGSHVESRGAPSTIPEGADVLDPPSLPSIHGESGGGLGHLVIQSLGTLNAADMMVALLALGVIGIVMALGIKQIETRLLRRRPEYRTRT